MSEDNICLHTYATTTCTGVSDDMPDRTMHITETNTHTSATAGCIGISDGVSDITERIPPVSGSTSRGGRLPGLYTYDIVKYKEKEYAIITIQHKKNEVKFVIDNCNLEKVLTRSWHLSSGKYIATHYTLPGAKGKEVFLHNFIKDTCMNDASNKVIVNINNNMLDNRIENLRLVEPSEYCPPRNNRKRTITLPPNSGFSVDDIPKYLSFMKANGEHGDRFAIEIPQINTFIKLSSSKKIPLNAKFQEAKEALNVIYKTYPELNPSINQLLKLELNESLEKILEAVNKTK